MAVGGRADFCSNLVEYGMYISNLIIFIGSAVVFVHGINTLVDRNFLSELLGTNLLTGAAYALVITSALACLLAFFGFFAAAREIKCMLLTYFILLFCVFVIMLIGGILCFVFREKVDLTMRQEMYSTIKLYGARREVTRSWDTTQARLKCCGVDTFRDWAGKLPVTCCKEIDRDGLQRLPCQDNPSFYNVYPDGCYDIGSAFVRERASYIGTYGIIVAVLMLFGMIFSCMFFNMIE